MGISVLTGSKLKIKSSDTSCFIAPTQYPNPVYNAQITCFFSEENLTLSFSSKFWNSDVREKKIISEGSNDHNKQFNCCHTWLKNLHKIKISFENIYFSGDNIVNRYNCEWKSYTNPQLSNKTRRFWAVILEYHIKGLFLIRLNLRIVRTWSWNISTLIWIKFLIHFMCSFYVLTNSHW